MAKIKFFKLSLEEFSAKYPNAGRGSDEVGEVRMPGSGWVAAEIADGKPSQFHTKDNGWEVVPRDAEFVELVKGKMSILDGF